MDNAAIFHRFPDSMLIARGRRLDALSLRRLIVIATLIVVLPLAWLGSLDSAAKEYVEVGLKRALVTFAAARTANAIISALQETTVSVTPLGVGVTASPGQILDPLNDLVEEFSTLMLAACVSLGIQRVLISVGGFPAVSVALTLGLLTWAWFSFRAVPPPQWLLRLLVVCLFLRFAVPLAALGSEATFRAVMSNQYADAQSRVDVASEQMRTFPPPTDAAHPESAIERWKLWLAEKKGHLLTDFSDLKEKVENVVQHIITLMALFVVQTVMLPLLFLFLVYKLFGATLTWTRAVP